MNKLLPIASIALLHISMLAAQSQSGQVQPYGFQDIHLGMVIAGFKIEHPAPVIEKYGPSASPRAGQAACTGPTGSAAEKRALNDAKKGIVRCYYTETYLSVPLQVNVIFVDGNLAVIDIIPPGDHSSCFDPAPTGGTALYFYSANCQQYPGLFQALTGTLGPGTALPVPEKQELHARRWATDISVAEFQNHMCGPWDNTDRGWSKAISEVLAGQYCINGDSLSYRQTIMLYLDKERSRTLAMRFGESTN
jgi:hypothetical protein